LKHKKGRIAIGIMYVIILFSAVYVTLMYLTHDPVNAPVVKNKLDQPGFSLTAWKVAFYPHIVLGTVALAIGPVQFLNRRRGKRQGHRILGRIYAAAIGINILVVPYMAIFATGGKGSTVAFLVLDAAWLWTTAMGVWRIWQRNVAAHRKWMVRSYAVTWGFVSFRLIVAVISLLTHAPTSVAFPVGVYVSLVLNLLVAEWLLRGRKAKPVSGSRPLREAVQAID
jgi:uncharacterized membrane protein YozB (DUF420 family)